MANDKDKLSNCGTHGGPGNQRKIRRLVPDTAAAPDPESERSKRRAGRTNFDGVTKSMRKAKARLDRRIKAFDSMKGEGAGNRAGSKYVRTVGQGKPVMFHKPGSSKKPCSLKV